MIKPALLITFFTASFCQQYPVYNYRYEQEDLMRGEPSNLPLHGYQVLESGYYPAEIGLGGVRSVDGLGGGGGFIQAGGPNGQYVLRNVAPVGLVGIGQNGGAGIGLGGIGYEGTGIGHGGLGYIGGAGIGGAVRGGQIIGLGRGDVGHHGYGGEDIQKGQFSEGKKKHNDEHFEKKEGKKGEAVNHGEQGYSKGEVAIKDVKGDSGYYKNAEGEKKVYEDGKEYHGGKHFNQEGKNEEEKTEKTFHKKGHKIKSFKNSHHKDESGKTEEYYDEAHDEGGNTAYKGESGSFGEKGQSEFKGGNEEGKYKTEEVKKEGHHSNEHLVDKANANHGKYGGNKHAAHQVLYGNKNGEEDQSLLGHQESSKFYKHQPFIIPFHY